MPPARRSAARRRTPPPQPVTVTRMARVVCAVCGRTLHYRTPATASTVLTPHYVERHPHVTGARPAA